MPVQHSEPFTSAPITRRRLTFGWIPPEDIISRQPILRQTGCLIRRINEKARIWVQLRFFHAMLRQTWLFPPPLPLQGADSLDDDCYAPDGMNIEKPCREWQEATERRLSLPWLNLPGTVLESFSQAFTFPGKTVLEPMSTHGPQLGMTHRSQQSVEGSIQVEIRPLTNEVSKLLIRVLNCSHVKQAVLRHHKTVLPWAFLSTHTILELENAEFISPVAPRPERGTFAIPCGQRGHSQLSSAPRP